MSVKNSFLEQWEIVRAMFVKIKCCIAGGARSATKRQMLTSTNPRGKIKNLRGRAVTFVSCSSKNKSVGIHSKQRF